MFCSAVFHMRNFFWEFPAFSIVLCSRLPSRRAFSVGRYVTKLAWSFQISLSNPSRERKKKLCSRASARVSGCCSAGTKEKRFVFVRSSWQSLSGCTASRFKSVQFRDRNFWLWHGWTDRSGLAVDESQYCSMFNTAEKGPFETAPSKKSLSAWYSTYCFVWMKRMEENMKMKI